MDDHLDTEVVYVTDFENSRSRFSESLTEYEPAIRSQGSYTEAWREKGESDRFWFDPHPVVEGGMGRIYRGYHAEEKRDVIIKVLKSPGNPLEAQGDWERQVREAQVQSSLEHPNIVEVYSAGYAVFPSAQNRRELSPYFVMEYVEGYPLSEYIGAEYDSAFVGNVIVQVSDAVDYLASKDIFHNDLKPQNILLSYTGEVKLSDFGVSPTVTDKSFCSPLFVSPERARGEATTLESEVFSLALITHRMLTREFAFNATEPGQILVNIHNDSYPGISRDQLEWNSHLASLSDKALTELNKVLRKATSKDPKQRYHSAKTYSQALNKALGNLE